MAFTGTDCIFIIIPAYNEASSIKSVVERILPKYPNVIVVDDGSTDGTCERLIGSNVIVLHHVINRGQGAALQTGIRFALMRGAGIIVTFDADGQHDERDIEALIAPIFRRECDVTLGSRFLGHARNIPPVRRLVLRLGIGFTRVVSRIRISDVHNGLRAFSRAAASSLHIKMDRMAHASEILDQIREGKWRYQEIPVNIYYSPYSLGKGQSSWNAFKIAFDVLVEKVAK